MVVVVIIGVLSTMAVLSMAQTAQRTSLRESARNLRLAAEYARMAAVTRGRHTRLVLHLQQPGYHLEIEAEPGEFVPLADDLLRASQLERGVSFQVVQIHAQQVWGHSENAVTFSPRGEADAARIVLSDGQASWTVRVAPSTGRVDLTAGVETEPLNDRVDMDLDR